MKLLIAAGGTGGHLYPGLAVAARLREREPDSDVLFVGTNRTIETEILQAHGERHESLPSERLQGMGLLQRLEALIRLPRAVRMARRLVRQFDPDLILGIGGYSSAPAMIAGWLTRTPSALLEPNSIPGLANRMVAPFVDRVFVAFPETERFFPRAKLRRTGVPVRKKLEEAPEARVRGDILAVLVLGGSQGAASINRAVIEALPALEGKPIRLIHQTGPKDYEEVRRAYETTRLSHEVFPFRPDLTPHYYEAGLVIARAGASTVAELVAARRPSILVPYPFAADDHQRWNALALVEAGGAELLLDSQLSGERLAKKITAYLSDEGRETLQRMRTALAALNPAGPKPADAILDECRALTGSRRGRRGG